jgi:hypothetical protein
MNIQAGMLVGIFALASLTDITATIAGSALSGNDIKALMADVTVEGKMSDGSSYSEFYQADGKIKGKDYTGKWTIEGDAMCFVYSTAQQKMCYQVGKNSDGINWIKDGKAEGTGTVTKGDVRNY